MTVKEALRDFKDWPKNYSLSLTRIIIYQKEEMVAVLDGPIIGALVDKGNKEIHFMVGNDDSKDAIKWAKQFGMKYTPFKQAMKKTNTRKKSK
jgi:hypothetical protein